MLSVIVMLADEKSFFPWLLTIADYLRWFFSLKYFFSTEVVLYIFLYNVQNFLKFNEKRWAYVINSVLRVIVKICTYKYWRI